MINKKYIFFIILFLVAKIYTQENSIKNISIENGLPSNTVFDIKQDHIGYLWIATDKGLVKYDGNDFKQINNIKTTHLYIQDEVVYASIETGLHIINKSKNHFIESKNIFAIFSDRKNIFTGTVEGVYRFVNNDLEPLKINSAIDFSNIKDILFCNNSFYLATNNGLWIIDDLLNPKQIHRITDEKVTSLEKIQNQIIASTNNGDLFIIQNKSIIKNIKTIENITSIKRLKNEIWISSNTEGIEILALPSFSFKQKINKYNSLKTNTVNSVYRDIQNSTYISSANGIYVLNNKPSVNQQNLSPTIHFENLQINHKTVDSLFNLKKIDLSTFQNNISISFKTIDHLNSKKIKYRYKLIGNFSPWSNNNSVQYPNLSAGHYKFEIQSKIADKKSNVKSFSFSIDKPFYKKEWFYFTIIISLLFIGYLSIHYYINKINKINKEKVDKLKLKNRLLSLEQKALQLQMNPHFIFNVLNGIKAQGNSGKTDELNDSITKFSILLRGMLNNSRKEEITLLEEIELLKNYIELEQRMSSMSFTYNIKENLNNIDPEEILIPTMLIQPFVENCIQHAFENNTIGKINIHFEVKYHFLNIMIIDNGIGINQSKKQKTNANHKSLALTVSKERLKILTSKSSFKINEIIEGKDVKGTKVSFRIPLKTDY